MMAHHDARKAHRNIAYGRAGRALARGHFLETLKEIPNEGQPSGTTHGKPQTPVDMVEAVVNYEAFLRVA